MDFKNIKFNLQRFAHNSIIDRSGAQSLMPEDVSREIVKNVPKNSVVMQFATKAQNMSRKQKRIPVLNTLPMAYFVNGDIGLKKTTDVEWGNKYFNAEEIACIVPIPEAVLEDSDYDIWGEIRPLIEEAMGVVFDSAVLFGTNSPAVWPDSLLTSATNAGNAVALGTGVDLYDDLLGTDGVISTLEDDGFMATGHIATMGMRGRYRSLRAADGTPIFKTSVQGATNYELDGSPVSFPENGVMDASQALQFSGDFRKVVYTMRQDISYKILDQAIIQDSAGNIVYNLPQQDMVALRAVMRLAWQVPNPINRIEQDEADRFPVAVLTP